MIFPAMLLMAEFRVVFFVAEFRAPFLVTFFVADFGAMLLAPHFTLTMAADAVDPDLIGTATIRDPNDRRATGDR